MSGRSLSKRWANVSLRAKITGVTVFILTLGLLVAGAGTLSFLQPQLIAKQDAELRQLRVDPTLALGPGANSASMTRDDVLYAPDRYYVAVLDSDGVLLYDNFRSHPAGSGPTIPMLTTNWVAENGDRSFTMRAADNSEWRGIATPIHSSTDTESASGTLIIAASTAAVNSTMAQFVTIFSGFGLAVILLGAALTRILVTTTFEPLAEVERTAHEIAAGDFSKRITVTSPTTEVGHLGRSLNTMLDRIDDAFTDRARTIDQMRRFVGDASHELRTPLVSVRGYAELYRMGALQTPEQVAQAMGRIEGEAVRMGSLVEDLLALARLDEKRAFEQRALDLIPLARDAALDTQAQDPSRTVTVIVDPSAVDAGATVAAIDPAPAGARQRGAPKRVLPTVPSGEDDVVAPAEQQKAAKAAPATLATGAIAFGSQALARLRRKGPGDGSQLTDASSVLSDSGPLPLVYEPRRPIVLGDEHKVRQVMSNLIGNALRHTPAGSPIDIVVSVAPQRGMARFDIVDHGEGIPEQIRERIFERFWRADTSRNRETGGSGLGLAIVSSIVAAHGGTVVARETPGGGATFSVELPLA